MNNNVEVIREKIKNSNITQLRRTSRYILHQLTYGAEKNIHCVARNNILVNLDNEEYMKDLAKRTGLAEKEIRQEIRDFFFIIPYRIMSICVDLKNDGYNEEDKEFVDRLLAEVNSHLEEEFNNDLFLS